MGVWGVGELEFMLQATRWRKLAWRAG